MNYAALIFLAAFFALSTSWYTFVLRPNVQVGQLQQTNMLGGNVLYPTARPGLAQQGLEVYRANGCMYCHSQQVVQEGSIYEVMVANAGTNQAAAATELARLIKQSEAEATKLLASLPQKILSGARRNTAEAAVKALNATGAQASLWISPTGADIARGWGRRRTVAEDYLFDNPVMLGSLRAGPDLANVGVRLPDLNWHLVHLYAPKAKVEGSPMPPYPYLFVERKIDRNPSPNALNLPAPYTPAAGYEVVPTHDAVALAAYLVSLRANAPLFSTPLSVASSVAANTGTNVPAPAAVDATNTTPANAPAQ